ncbi:hypothetical protein CN093_17440 [Sinorhizobium meliloti]|uniref:hypothetical protein n=1 Tax=Rhizobium meliloti TaxID=382 RepID=UPI000FD5EFB7|nr:hypothetical protein [Sinorhizobium meliloti]RVO38509.1 hypothetical protein CN093_17440 [Sinorhizobium meliloti]RVR12113.1 hypothetical protein CN243_05045 [Sinorhizobium meliloti]
MSLAFRYGLRNRCATILRTGMEAFVEDHHFYKLLTEQFELAEKRRYSIISLLMLIALELAAIAVILWMR